MDEELKQNLTAAETWIRGLFILLFAFFLVIARIVTSAVVVIQFLFTVFSGQTNKNLKNFGGSLSRYIYQCLLFITYNSNDKPFPFDEWPEPVVLKEVDEAAEIESAEKPKAAPKKKASAKKKSTAKKAAKAKAEPNSEGKAEADAGTTVDSSGASTDETDTKPEN